MSLWPRKQPPADTDVEEAREMRAEAQQAHRDAIITGFTVAQITSYIAERRALNHFGDDLSISIRPRRAH